MIKHDNNPAALHKETAEKIMRLFLSLIATASLALAIASLSPAWADGASGKGYSYGSSEVYNQGAATMTPPTAQGAPAAAGAPVTTAPAPIVIGVPAPPTQTLPTCVPGPLGDCRAGGSNP
jgi:hypothetical protein